jgi:hypothetical protein
MRQWLLRASLRLRVSLRISLRMCRTSLWLRSIVLLRAGRLRQLLRSLWQETLRIAFQAVRQPRLQEELLRQRML